MSGPLPTSMVEKPWGRDRLPPPFLTAGDRRIGEIWFEPPPELPQLLVKYIFTSEKLSVQVHPSDQQTQAAAMGRQGKEECWLILDAEPGARLGIGFTEPITAQAMRAAALDGSIESRMSWHAVAPGDFFYIPAGTVHAIGPGVSLIEVQQNSDITYRLFDYGRPRELHLEEGVAVARGEPYDPGLRKKAPLGAAMRLVEGPHFRLDQVIGHGFAQAAERYRGPLLVMPRDAAARVDGLVVAPGECGIAMDFAEIAFEPSGTYLIAQSCNP